MAGPSPRLDADVNVTPTARRVGNHLVEVNVGQENGLHDPVGVQPRNLDVGRLTREVGRRLASIHGPVDGR